MDEMKTKRAIQTFRSPTIYVLVIYYEPNDIAGIREFQRKSGPRALEDDLDTEWQGHFQENIRTNNPTEKVELDVTHA